MTIVAVVPVKRTAAAKQRLAGALPAALRRELMLAMLGDVLHCLVQCPALEIVVATSDPAAAGLAQSFGARLSQTDADFGHSEAVAAAARRLAPGDALLTLPADLPLVEPDDVARVMAALDEAAFVIVPARDGLGSNAVLMRPPDAVPLRFGGASYPRHLAAARARGVEPRSLDLPRIGLDIDTPDDLEAFLAVPSRTRARALLERHGMAA